MSEVVKTLKYDDYNIYFDSEVNKPLCFCYNFISESKYNKTKKEVFSSIYELGKKIYDTLLINNIQLIISPTLEKRINDRYIYDDIEIFSNLENIIMTTEIKDIILEYFKINGAPNFLYNPRYINKTLKSKLNILFGNNSNGMTDVYDNFNNYQIELIPLVNIALVIYFTYTIKNKIASTSTKRLDSLLRPFPALIDLYKKNYIMKFVITDEETANNEQVLKKIIDYFKILIYYFQLYIKKEIEITNNTEITFPETITIPTSDKKWIDFNFLTTEYISLNPFLTAVEYLLQVLSVKNNTITSYLCERCGNIMNNNNYLCYDCKTTLYCEMLAKYERQNKTEKHQALLEEKENYDNDNNTYTPLIIKIFKDRNYHTTYDNIPKNKDRKRNLKNKR